LACHLHFTSAMLLCGVKNNCSNHLDIIHEMMNVQDPDGMSGEFDN
jgi:hypothetical protein